LKQLELNGAEVCILSPETLPLGAAAWLLEHIQEAVATKGWAALALSGGATPKPLYRLLAEPDQAELWPWERVRLFWADERCVPPDDPQSNYNMTCRTLLDHLPRRPEVFRMRGEDEPHAAAEAYAALLKRHAPSGLDVLLLGMGEDGHTASLFPGSAAASETVRSVVAAHVPKAGWRLTLTPAAMRAARRVLLLVTGAGKAEVLAEVLTGPLAPVRYPAQLLRGHAGAVWMVDEAAASRLGVP